MIPKNIIICWFGDANNMRKEIELKCIDRVKEVFPDYNIILVNEQTFDVNRYEYTKKCYAEKKYAFVSDIARLQTLYDVGGIYLDTDVFILRRFDNALLQHQCFIGAKQECTDIPHHSDIISSGVIGAEQHSSFIKDVLDTALTSTSILPYMLSLNHMILNRGFKRSEIKNLAEITTKQDVTVYPSYYFSCTFFNSYELHITEQSYAVHLYDASWHGKKHRAAQLQRIQILFETINKHIEKKTRQKANY